MKQTILNLFNNSSLLDKDSLKNDGVKHIQHSVLLNRNNIKWIDAAYIGTDDGLYFMIIDSNDEIKSVQYENMNASDINEWYCNLMSKLNIQTGEKFIIIKTIGKHNSFVEREFDDEESAKLFVSLLRESEQHDFIRYHITKVINY